MDKLPIAPRQADETEEDFQRRYAREKMRLYRARRPKSERKRGKGKAPARNGKLTQAEWEALQPFPGESPADHRRRYNREMQRRYREEHKDRIAIERRQAYAADPEPERERQRRTRRDHPERQRAYDRRYDFKNPGARAARLKKWQDENPERHREAREQWRLNNLDVCASYASARRAAEMGAIPLWADMEAIRAMYAEARRLTVETGVEHHVDHMVPIKNALVCGLHDSSNMRVIPGAENVRKRNSLDYALIYGLHGCDEHGWPQCAPRLTSRLPDCPTGCVAR